MITRAPNRLIALAYESYECCQRRTPLLSLTNHASLTAREQEVLDRLCSGDSAPRIAVSLTVSTNTIRTHLARLRRKTKTKTAHGLVSWAYIHQGCCVLDLRREDQCHAIR